MSKKKLTAKRKKQLLTMFAVAGVMGNTGIAPTMALADTLSPTAETSTEQTQANEAKEAIDQTIQNVTDPLVNPTDSTTTASDSLATTDEATDETTENTQEQAKEQEQATAATAESEGNATNPTAEAPKVAQKANVAAASKITGTWGTSPYTFDENTGVLTIGAGELSGYKESPWFENKKVDAKAIKKIVLSGKVVAPEDSKSLFSGYYLMNATEIEGFSQLNTSNVTNMESMFKGMRNMTSLDLSGFDTSNVTNMEYMFNEMSSLTSLDLSGFDTSNATDMEYMFANTPLKKLILGDTFKFVNGQGALTSAWKREDGKGKAYTADNFMKNYGTGDLTAGTYVSATGWWGTSPYNFDIYTGTLTIEAGELSGYEESPWNSGKVDLEAIKKIVLSGKVVAPEDSRYLFSTSTPGKDLTNVTEIEGLSQLDTSNVTTMRYMFYGMSSVTSLDVSSFDTSKATDMGYMFRNMSSVTSLDVSGFDTSKVKDMGYMFRGMNSVTSLDVSNFDTSKVTSMSYMFADTPLKKLILGDTFKFVNGTGALTSAWKREDGKGKAYTADDFIKNYGTGDLTAGAYVSATGWWGTSPYNFDKNTGTLTIEAGELSGYEESPWNSGTVGLEVIKKIVLSGKVVAPENSKYLFTTNTVGKDLTNVTEIEGLSQLDTSNVTNMNAAFYGMSSVTSLDLSSFDTSKVTSMSNMFYKTPLKKLTLGDTFKFVKSASGTAGLTSVWMREDGKGTFYSAADFMNNYGIGDLTAGTYVSVETDTWGTSPYMFDEDTGTLTIGAGELSGYEESPWNSDKVDSEAIKKVVLSGKVVAPENASLLFTGTSNKGDLTNVTEIEGLSQLDTSNVTDMRSMFYGMSSVTSLDVSGFDTGNVTDMKSMFNGMSSVTSLDVSGFDTSNVTEMEYMFRHMSSVTSLDLSNFDTRKVTDMSYMFDDMGSVTSLDLSNFDTNNVTDMTNMFFGTSLKKLILGDTFKFVAGKGALASAWKREDGKGKAYTAKDFMNNYGTGDLTAGTYVSVETGIWGTSPYNFDKNTGTLTIEAGELSGYEESPWNSDKVDIKAIKKIVLSGKVVAPENANLLFTGSISKGNLMNVTEIEGLSQLDTSNVTAMQSMFYGLSSVTSLDVSGFDTSNVTTMDNMFYNISSVTSLDVSGFDTSNVTTMKNMFVDTSLNKLTLGDHFKAVGDTGLSAPKALNDGDQLTGNWIREDGQSKGYSPADFMTNYGTGDLTAGTYVAELVKNELKPQEYHVGDVNITGTYTGDMSLGRLTVNGKVVSWGGSFKDGQFSYYVGVGKLKVGDKVVLDGYNKEKKLMDSKEIEVISESSGSIDQVDNYKLGDSNITGTYTGDIHKGKLVVNGEVISWGGTYKDGKFSYYVNSQIIKAGDQATIQGYDKFDTPLGDPQPVTIGEQLGQLTEAHRVGISTVIEGSYTGDVYQGILLVNGEKVSQGGSFKDGKFSYYVGNLKVSEDDQVVLMGANNRGQQIPGSEIDVTIQTPTAEINELTYKIGTQTIKGAYGSDTQVHQGHLFVNGKLISKGGSFKDGAISYYVKPDLIKADDQVTMNFYDGSGNLLAEKQTVSVN
ncbi:BspA family leucine-rich repeat surface protein [Enterococcus hirae]|uniref:BspA family leucine-rich repeat surface protein n=1 Tax=Enterococcus hirae TaxID=1354 RepID=UPI001368CA8E|nr:BspA family leucine-rich repeat surface protein [Enterococcus hirae]NAD92813.1 BspA family leucine-rich repeat surface protein [Enterococcus hirae]